MFQPIRKFRSDIRMITKPLTWIFVPLCFFSSIVGAISSTEYESTSLLTLLGAFLFPWTIGLVIYLFFYLIKLYFTITVFNDGIKCYDKAGLYQFVKWEQITKVYPESVEGFAYVFLEAEGLKRPLTIPLYLEDMKDFIMLIKKKIG